MKNIFLLFTTILVLFQASLTAKVVVVSDTMTDKAIDSKLNKMQAGDTLYLKKGCYKKNFKLIGLHGMPDKPIVIQGEDRTNTIIDGGASTPSSTLKNYGFHIANSSWITVANLSFKNCWVDVIRVDNSSYISLLKANIEGGRRAMFAEGRKSHHFLIENCYWEQGEHVWTKNGEFSWAELHHGQHRYYNGSLFQSKMIGGSFVLRDNYLKNVYNGFRLSIMGETESDTLACTNGEIYRNVIENSADNAFEPEVYCKNLHFYHNRMINSHAFISITEVGGGPLYFYGNTGVKLPDCKDGWTIFKFIGTERRLTKNMYIFNNSWQVDSDVLGRKLETHWHNDNIHHFNNAYYVSKADTMGIYYLGKNNVFENDCANIPFPKLTTQTSNYQTIIANPMFVDGKHGNFLLDKESPCRNRGIVPEGMSIGFTGDKLDIGAYDDGCLVEGPPFRYENPGAEMTAQEKPRIVKHKIEANILSLWFSYPLDSSTIQANNFSLEGSEKKCHFQHYELQEDGYLLVLKSAETLPHENVSLAVRNKPKGTNEEEMCLWASSIPAALVSKEEQVLSLTKKIADKLIANTCFDFEPKTVTYNANVAHFSIDEAILDAPNQVAYGLITINAEQASDVFLGFSFRGNIQVFLNNSPIYSGQSAEESFREYTYNRFEFANTQKVNLRAGENKLLVKASGGYEGLVFSCCIQKPNGEFDNNYPIVNNISNTYINNWLVASPFFADTDRAMDSIFEPEILLKEYYKQGSRIVSWQLQQPMLEQAFTVPSGKTNKKGFDANWHYANSNTLLGILNLYKASNDNRYKQFVETYNQQVFNNYDFFREQYLSKRVLRGAYFRLFRATMLDDTGGAILPLAEMPITGQSKNLHRELLNQTLDYVLHKQSRLADGTLCRPEPIENTVWADDLFMSVPFLLRMAKINGDPKLYDEAAFQVLSFNKYLTDRNTNLYRHGWYDQHKELAPVAWARANGWMVWASSEALLEIPLSHKDYNKIKNMFVNHLKAVLSYQSTDGLWHQVIDRPDSYLETSGSAMFALGLARAINNGWIDNSYKPQLLKAWHAVARQIDENGTVNGICRGTDMGKDANYYMNQKPLEDDPRGLGAVLSLGAEMSYFFHNQNTNSKHEIR